MNLIAALRARLSGPVRLEFEQAAIRLTMAGIVLVYVVWGAYGVPEHDRTVLVGVEGFFILAFAIVVAISIWPTPNVMRRVAGMVADVGITTFALFPMGEGGTVIVGVYLVIIFGNGFRYGRAYLYSSQALSAVAFLFAALMAPWWREHPSTMIGFLMILIVVPSYVGTLAERINQARLKAEQELQECREQYLRSN